MQLGNGIYYSICSLKAQHVSSRTSLIIRSSNCICSLWFTYVCGDRPESSLSGNWLMHTANTVGVPDDERHTARNLLSF